MIPRRSQPGSALLLVVILLGVLAAVGAAAVALSSRDRINAGAKTRRDLMIACATAAQMKTWAELSRYGPKWLGSPDSMATETVLADGTRFAPLHYAQSAGAAIKDVVVAFSDPVAAEITRDITNRSQALMGNATATRSVARCTIPGGLLSPDRVLEVEFSMRLPVK